MQLSIVTTLYRSSPYLPEFYRRACAAAAQITPDFELILVNDGSPDDSLAVATGLYEKDARVRIVDLSRNFGQHKAMMTGLAHARGDLAFLIDCDLELAPETLLRCRAEMCRTGADVVYGVQQTRQDPLLDRIAGRLFYTIFNWLSTDPLPANLLMLRLMTRRYVTALVAHRERELLIGGLWAVTGFDQTPIVVEKAHKGHTAYNVRRRVAMLVNAITSFSNKPLVFIFYLGIGISLLAGIAAIYLVIRRIFFGEFLAGWPSLIVSIWFLSGLVIFCLGIIGIYLSKIFTETKQRPYTITRKVYERDAGDSERLEGPLQG